MDRYSKFEDYFAAKEKIFLNQTESDYLILNYDAQNLRRLKNMARSKTFFYSRLENTNGVYIKDSDIICASSGSVLKTLSIEDIFLQGVHNIENVMACVLAGSIVGVRHDSIREAVKSFKGLSHRVELVDVVNGVRYIDDSKGTTVDSTRRALESLKFGVVLIAGGRDKNSDYTALRDALKDRVRHLVLMGEAKEKIRIALGDMAETHDASDMREAVHIAHRLAVPGGSVLLSPMCSSFDMFRDYKQRGDVFKEAVAELKRRA